MKRYALNLLLPPPIHQWKVSIKSTSDERSSPIGKLLWIHLSLSTPPPTKWPAAWKLSSSLLSLWVWKSTEETLAISPALSGNAVGSGTWQLPTFSVRHRKPVSNGLFLRHKMFPFLKKAVGEIHSKRDQICKGRERKATLSINQARTKYHFVWGVGNVWWEIGLFSTPT